MLQAYVGIHQPKDLSEADVARKRLIFDEFFYLQVIAILIIVNILNRILDTTLLCFNHFMASNLDLLLLFLFLL